MFKINLDLDNSKYNNSVLSLLKILENNSELNLTLDQLHQLSTYINLAENLFIEVEPMKAKEYLVKNKVINEWTILEYNSKIKIKDLIEDIFNKYDVNISMISYNEQIIYSIFNDDDVNITFEKLFNKYSIVSDKIVLSVSLDEDIEQFPNIIIYN